MMGDLQPGTLATLKGVKQRVYVWPAPWVSSSAACMQAISSGSVVLVVGAVAIDLPTDQANQQRAPLQWRLVVGHDGDRVVVGWLVAGWLGEVRQ